MVLQHLLQAKVNSRSALRLSPVLKVQAPRKYGHKSQRLRSLANLKLMALQVAVVMQAFLALLYLLVCATRKLQISLLRRRDCRLFKDTCCNNRNLLVALVVLRRVLLRLALHLLRTRKIHLHLGFRCKRANCRRQLRKHHLMIRSPKM